MKQELLENPNYLFLKAVFMKPSLALRGNEFYVYEMLKSVNNGLSTQELASEIKVSAPHINQILKRLTDKGFVTRKPLSNENGFVYFALSPELAEELHLFD